MGGGVQRPSPPRRGCRRVSREVPRREGAGRRAGADRASLHRGVQRGELRRRTMDREHEDDEGMSMPKRVAAGAALGVAVPAAVAVAKKLIGNGDDEESDEDQALARDSGSSEKRQRTAKPNTS